MVPGILGLAIIVIVSFHTYKTARDNGRNPALWVSAAVGIGILFQWILPILLVIVLAVVMIATGTAPNRIEEDLGWWPFLINFIFLGLSIVALIFLLKYVSRISDEVEAEPPPPPIFDPNGS